jgi:hypothetical protein
MYDKNLLSLWTNLSGIIKSRNFENNELILYYVDMFFVVIIFYEFPCMAVYLLKDINKL